MNIDFENPFSVTKATEFSDLEINEYWVDFNYEEKDSVSILNPLETIPKYVLGGKGCGKTHLLRYYSYPLQKIRALGDVRKLVESNTYLGIYSILDGLSSSRFAGKGIPDQEWNSVFEYYFELYLTNNLLSVIKEIFQELKISEDQEIKTVKKIAGIFYESADNVNINSIDSLNTYLNDLRRKIDLEIVNAPFNRKLNYDNVKILFSPGDLIFQIPLIIASEIECLQKMKFIYILDEYEKLFEWQKVFINSLVWEKKNPVTFWIGARRYGYTTTLTKSREEMKAGSEYVPVYLDLLIRKNEDLYKKFAKELYIKRLKRFYVSRDSNITEDEIEKSLCLKFEEYSDDKFVLEVKKKCKTNDFKHLKNLKDKLESVLQKGSFHGITSVDDIDSIINNLISDVIDNPLEQKFKIFRFYKKWSKLDKNENFRLIVNEINEEYNVYLSGGVSIFKNIKEKYKQDFLAQLSNENNIKNICYSGIDDFIGISWGNPRCFILILKKIIEYAKLRGEKPLEEGSLISLETQYLGVYDTAKWFYEDAEIIGEKGKNLYKSITFLTDMFRAYRFADKPTETSISSFNFGIDDISEKASEYIKLAELHSLIVEIQGGRKEKNSGRVEKLFQLNKTLAPLWNLPTIRRGTLSLDKKSLDSIFNPEHQEEFIKLFKEIKAKLNAPTFGKKTNKTPTKKSISPNNPSLFNNKDTPEA